MLVTNFLILCVLMLALWAYCVRIKDVSVIDAFWPLGMVILAAASFWMGAGPLERRALITGLTALWGLRLSWHLFTRWRAHGIDPRYAAILGRQMEKKGWSFARASFVQVFVLQAILLFIVCLPAQLGQVDVQPSALGPMALVGALMALVGIGFEAVGDAQLKRFRNDTANTGKVMQSGLWRYTRHPNYFGDALTWWGIWLVAAETRAGAFTVFAPVLLTWLLTRLSGVPMLEHRLKKSRPGYAEYVARTSSFIPWPPKRSA